MYDMDEFVTKIIDIGTCFYRGGFSGDDSMCLSDYTMIFYPNDTKKQNSYYVGCFNGEVSKVKKPIERGAIKNWDDMEIILDEIFKQFERYHISSRSVLHVDSLLDPTINRGKMSEIMFENAGLFTTLIINIGHGTTQIVPVYELSAITSAASELNISGVDITQMFENLLYERGYTFNDPTDIEYLKRKSSYVADDFESELIKAKTTNECNQTISVDSQEITLSYERFVCYEQLFRNQSNGFNQKGIVEAAYDSIMSLDEELRKKIKCIYLMGGSTLVDGLIDRFDKELTKKMENKNIKFKILATVERPKNSWVGASIFSSLSWYDQAYVKKDEYDEYGLSFVLKKCFN
ncbi:actin-75 [Histomonas meleagridis]|uniref:actin-75 n=1 Tax=Histomonas meleagridis TaxID=135588 RepID=UPI00355A3C0F|nr:actin-75 [Histomonas meleagridis]KAH0797763.1 actin-75 [Histomonas meleagridis]